MKKASEPWYCPDCSAPCASCTDPVLNEHQGIQCDTCDFWYHAKCADVDESAYLELASSSSAWGCPSCLDKSTSSTLLDDSDGETVLDATLPSQETADQGNDYSKATKANGCQKNKLRILLVNFQSVKEKSADVSSLIDMHQPDIICGTETWLNKDISSSEIFPDSYVVYRKDRDTRGGGVLHAIKRNLV
jgi:hypothetical protein